MKKQVFLILVLVLASSYKLFASTGNANDGLLFILVIIGFLAVLSGIFSGANYLKNNGKFLINKLKTSYKKVILILKDYLNLSKSKHLRSLHS